MEKLLNVKRHLKQIIVCDYYEMNNYNISLILLLILEIIFLSIY